MWTTPTNIDDSILSFSKSLDCSWVGAILVEPHAEYDYDNCHNNVYTHTQLESGSPVIGWYIIDGGVTLQAVRHTVWNNGEMLVDVTPYKDNRDFIIFARSAIQNTDYSVPNCYSRSLSNSITHEISNMYYVYKLVDPRTNEPFYIGKGDRETTPLQSKLTTRNKYKENKIDSIRNAGLAPIIEYIAENIIEERLAYDIEEALIKMYRYKDTLLGRKLEVMKND